MALIFGRNFSDTLTGTRGHDTIIGWNEANPVGDEGSARDSDDLFGNAGDDLLQGGACDDWLYGGIGNDLLRGGSGNNTLVGGAGDDHFSSFQFDLEAVHADRIIGGAGFDTLELDRSNSMLSFNFSIANAAVMQVLADGTHILGIEGLSFAAGGGDDTIIGGGFSDSLLGGSGDDQLRGGSGGDLIAGDIVSDRGSDPRPNEENADALFGGFGADSLYGGAGSDQVFGGDGNELIFGEEWDDRLFGGAGNDTIFGDFGDPTYGIGKSMSDLGMLGGPHSFSDTIFGGAGDDFISGDWGGNLLSGGIGADTFYFGVGSSSLDNSATQVDEISDFTSGEDLIQMFSLNWQNASGNFRLSDADFVIGTEAGDASDRVMYDPTTGEIRMDFDGTGSMVAELFATVAPGTVLVASDFELLVF